jgi:hypothetical protein
VSRAETAWRHDIRNLDPESRLWLPELIVPGLGPTIVGRVGPNRWELTLVSGPVAAPSVACDERGRVLVPLGVRRTLGLDQTVVVSVSATDSDGRVVIWPTAALDILLEAAP